MPLNVEVFASHAGEDHRDLMQQMLDKGYRFIISQVASDGLMNWLGRELTKDNLKIFFNDADKYGFDSGGEGGYYDSLALAGPIFGNKQLEVKEVKKIVENKYCGHIIINKFNIVENPLTSHIYKIQPS